MEAKDAWLKEKKEKEDDLWEREEELMATRDVWYTQKERDDAEKKSKDEVFSALKEAFGGDDPKEEEMEYASAMLHQHR